MQPSTLIKGFDKKRLKALLTLFFLALAVPTGVLIWQAYSQLKWEAFHQYRGMAEELTERIDMSLAELIDGAEDRSYADYSFLVITGDVSANYARPSALSAFPVAENLPGLIGHFQVDDDGDFSTPLLPPNQVEAETYGISAVEYVRREALADEIRTVLSDNQLVQARTTDPGGRKRALRLAQESPTDSIEEVVVADASSVGITANVDFNEPEMDTTSEGRLNAVVPEMFEDADEVVLERDQAASTTYSQAVFDQLNVPASAPAPAIAQNGSFGMEASLEMETSQDKERANTLGKVADLKLDSELEKKSEAAERDSRQSKDSPTAVSTPAKPVARAKRIETEAVAEVVVDDIRISTFESEIDPFEFSLLDSGHFVMFRKVWRNGERYIQGLLINQRVFINAVIIQQFQGTALAQMSNLIVSFQDDVIHTANGLPGRRYTSDVSEMQGDLLYQGRLSAPLDSVGMIFSINRLPAGPGASVLGWVTLVLAIVFMSGFYAMYRFSLGQIQLARQQQDFVSAVSHELKTPLTSIRMYGEMLKDGWADKEKQQQYYEYIHDESERLTRLISNVLQLASITRNEPQLDVKPIAVSALMNQIESKISHQVQRAGFELKLTTEAAAENAAIGIDDDCFAQIIINLVDNAIKFSKNAERNVIDIHVRLDKQQRAVFSIRDFGAGIPKDQMKKIFKLFYRSESELTRETVGTGIGLAIVHQLTQAMGGTVDVTNVDPGAEFRVSFPVR